MDELTERKYNVRDTKKNYSLLNTAALNGLEIVTYKGINKNTKKNGEVSHIKTDYVDYLMKFVKFNPVIESGEELGGYTVSLKEIDMYGEGATVEKAKEDLLNSVMEYIDIYVDQIELFSKVESIEKQIYMLKLIRCDGDRNKIKKEIGL